MMNISSVKSVFEQPSFGMLVIRASVGILMFINGMNKFSGGEDTLRSVGSAIKNIGIDPGNGAIALFFGIMAAGSQLIGGGLLVIGWFFRLGALFVSLTMAVATLEVMSRAGSGMGDWGYPMLLALCSFGLLWTGPGRWSVSE